MSDRPLAAVVLAAGLGTRMHSARAKVLHELCGVPLVCYPLRALAALRAARVVLVVGHQADAVRTAGERVGLRDLRVALQLEQRGTGHAVRCAENALADFAGDVIILYGDVPLIRAATLQDLLATHRRTQADVTLVAVRLPDPTGYGRIVRDARGTVSAIVEERDASLAQRAVDEVNAGIYVVRNELLFALLRELRPNNAQGELYLTDIVALAARTGRRVEAVLVERPQEVAGINTRAELAGMAKQLQDELVKKWMATGVTFEDPATAYLGPEVTIGRDTVVGPNVQLRGKTVIGAACRIEGTAYLIDTTLAERVLVKFGTVAEGAHVGADAVLGPYARLRPGTKLAERVHLGNFVETKQAHLGAGTKANHLSYLGDCEIGPETNVGAGTITCNYDGFRKHRTRIGARVQIGSDTQLVAPVSVGDDAYLGAGTTVTKDVPEGALAVTRVPVRFVLGWTARRRMLEAGGGKMAKKPPALAKPAPSRSPRRGHIKVRARASAKARRRRR